MAGKIRLRVPPRHRDVLAALARMPDADSSELLRSIGSATEPLSRQALVGLFSSAGVDDPEEMVNALVGLEGSRSSHDWTVAEIAEAISVAAGLDLDEGERSSLSARVDVLLSHKTFSRAAKADMLRSSHPRVLYSARVLTDIRPVFDEVIEEAPVGAVVSHQLELSVISADDPTLFYVALTDDEIEKLQAQLSRALDKARASRAMIERAKVPIHMGLGAKD